MARGLSDALGALDLDERDSSLDLALIISSVEADRPDVADELQSLQAIFGLDESTPTLSLYRPAPTARTPSPPDWSPSSPDPLRLILRLTLPDPHEEHAMHLLLSLPPGYPSSAPPLLQLQDRYLSSFAVDDELFGAVLRTYMHDSEAGVAAGVVEWTGDVCLYEGIEAVREKCGQWVKERAEEKQRGEERRQGNGEEEVMGRRSAGFRAEDYEDEDEDEELEERIEEIERGPRLAPVATVKCPKITSAEPLVDRKSVFIGHAARVTSVDEVNAVMAELLSNSRIARATHNMSAYQFTSSDGIRRADNDDDGESAAGSRLAQLLSLIDVDNVMVVVTRFYGGVHLGSTRFKDINQAAREALAAAGLLHQEVEKETKGGKGGKKR